MKNVVDLIRIEVVVFLNRLAKSRFIAMVLKGSGSLALGQLVRLDYGLVTWW